LPEDGRQEIQTYYTDRFYYVYCGDGGFDAGFWRGSPRRAGVFDRIVDQAIEPGVEDAVENVVHPESPFKDTEGHWGESYIAMAVSRGLFGGYDENRFGPDDPVKRDQFVTTLYRMAGSPEASAEAPFGDISGEIQEFRQAIAWAVENQYINGTGPNRFDPKTKLSRQAAMKILYSYSGGLKGMDSLFTATYYKCFADAGKIDDWGKNPMYWGVFNGLVSASADGRLKPKENVTRAQLAKILVTYGQRFGSNGPVDIAAGKTETQEPVGIYNLKAEKRVAHQVTLIARTAEGKRLGGKIVVIDDRKVTLFQDAKRIEMEYSGAEDGQDYFATIQKDTDVIPSMETLLALDQASAEGDTVSFLLYPGSLEPGSIYYIYLSSCGEESFTPLGKVASFRTYEQ